MSEAGTAATAPKLNARQRLFVAEYLRDKNATQAAIRAGYSEATARVIGPENLRKPAIRLAIDAAIEAELAKVQQETGVSLERTLREIGRIAYFDPRKMFGPDSAPKAITELDDDTAAVIAGLEVSEESTGYGEDRRVIGTVKKWKLADKGGALDKLMKHFGAYAKDNEATVKVEDKTPPDPADVARRVAFILTAAMRKKQQTKD